MQPHLPPLNVENVLKEQIFFKLPQVSLNLKVNGTVRAEVVDVLPSGSVLVRINGQELEMRTEIPLQKDTTLLLKVLGMPGSEKAIKLQLLEILNPQKEKIEKKLQSLDLRKDIQLALQIALGKKDEKALQILLQKGLNEQLQRMNQEISEILKPKEFQLLTASKDFQSLITQAKELLQKGDHDRLNEVLDSIKKLPQTNKSQSPIIRYLMDAKSGEIFMRRFEQISDVFVPVDELQTMQGTELQKWISQSGTFLEKKLDTLLKQFMLLQSVQEQIAYKKPDEIKEFILNTSILDKDVKNIFQKSFQESLEQTIKKAFSHLQKKADEMITHDLKALVSQMRESLGNEPQINSLYQNLQNFQLYSLLSGMLYTYLPIIWHELKEGSLRIFVDKKHYFCHIDLNFNDIGKVQAELLLMQNSLKIDFFIEDDEFRKVIQQNQQELLDELQEFEDVLVTFVSQEQSKNRYTIKSGIDIAI